MWSWTAVISPHALQRNNSQRRRAALQRRTKTTPKHKSIMHTFNSEACNFYTLHSMQERGFITYWSTHDALIIWGHEDVNFISRAALTVRSQQTRMKCYARMIYMLSQCKDAIDNIAALFARIERLGRLNLADICAALTNQELALAVTSLRAEAENPKQQCGYPELYDTTSYFYKNRNTFSNETGAACRSPPPWREFTSVV